MDSNPDPTDAIVPPATDAPAPPRRRYLTIRRPRCPVCAGTRLLTYRTFQNGDGSATRYAQCADCGVKLTIVVE